ncbi:hypothetical protein PTKIN_Ptkin11bG0101000 [Pterospermum kingtungense]
MSSSSCGCLKLNVDASYHDMDNSTQFGFEIHNEHGDTILSGLRWFPYISSALHVEFLFVLFGLQEASLYGY